MSRMTITRCGAIEAALPCRTTARVVVVMLFICLVQCGCQFAPTTRPEFWPWKKDTPAEMPERLLAVWSDSVLHQPGQPGVRGFGGRIYFYHSTGNDPVKVDGGLAVYVFDADELDPYDQKPLRKFMFTADQFEEHLSKTALGSSYSVWLPLDEVGGEARRLSLITRFEGREGGTVISDPTIKLLPGIPKLAKKGDPTDPESKTSPVRAVGHVTRSSQQLVTRESLRGRDIQTIDLPPNFNRRLEAAPIDNSEVSSAANPTSQSAQPPPVSDSKGQLGGDSLNRMDQFHPGRPDDKLLDLPGLRELEESNFIHPPAFADADPKNKLSDSSQGSRGSGPPRPDFQSRNQGSDSRRTGFINPPR